MLAILDFDAAIIIIKCVIHKGPKKINTQICTDFK